MENDERWVSLLFLSLLTLSKFSIFLKCLLWQAFFCFHENFCPCLTESNGQLQQVSISCCKHLFSFSKCSTFSSAFLALRFASPSNCSNTSLSEIVDSILRACIRQPCNICLFIDRYYNPIIRDCSYYYYHNYNKYNTVTL